MKMEYAPKKIDRLSFRKRENKFVVFNGETSIFSVISPDGFYLLNLCDGKMTVKDMIEEFSKKYKVKNKAKAKDDVLSFLKELAMRCLIK